MIISSKIIEGINGNVIIPGDKSISHRSIIIPSISNGISEISNILWSEDVKHTLNAFMDMGVKVINENDKLIIYGKGLNSLKKPNKKLYLGNSGTSARLLTGLLASQNFESIIIGDESLSKRPMDRITNPLKIMGAKFEMNDKSLPLRILGQNLNNLNYELRLPSAQVKSGLMLAALNTSGKSKIIEKKISRDHTEIMLKFFESDIEIKSFDTEKHIIINGKKELNSKNIEVPSDLSSAAFFIVATLINNNSNITLKNINLNPTRDGVLKALNLMKANISIRNKKIINGEIVGDIEVKTSNLSGCDLSHDMARLMIDEYPILAIAASFANSPSIFRGLKELKVKESDRLELIKYNLDQCGIFCQINNDDLFIDPTKKFDVKNNIIKTDNDHRIAMSFAIMGLKLGVDLKIPNSEYIATSFPNFVKLVNSVGGKLIE